MIGRDERRGEWERDERYQQLVELSPDGILVHDGARIVLGNAAAARLAGAKRREDLIDLPIETFLHPPYLKAVQAELTETGILAELAPPVRDTFRRLDGSEIEVEVRAVAFMDHGRASAHLVIRDITERLAAEQTARLNEERLQQAQRLEAVGALAGGVAHEVNNMMGVVLGFSEFLLRDERLPADCLTDVRQVMKAADRAAAVSRQLLAFGRRAVHRPQTTDLAAALRDAEPVLRQITGEGRSLVVRADLAPQVWVDPGQLQQVLINLALNARDAMPDGGTLTLTTGEADLAGDLEGGEPPGRYATLTVRDTGAGMSAAVQARIFEPFFTTKPLGRGTGLGLAAVDGILKQHHGWIDVESVPGAGALFTVFLPVLPALAPEMSRSGYPEPLEETTRSGATVLVADDESGVRVIVARSLEDAGFRVLQASDGGEALELVDRHGPPELVLTDLAMPGMGGAELARCLRQRWPELPILFMSGYSAEELRRDGAIGSEGELIEKPFSPGGLVATVTAVLSRVRVRGLGIG